MPPALRKHVRYQMLLKLQASVYSVYHAADRVFYNREICGRRVRGQ